MKITPLHDRVIVKRVAEETMTAGGIVLPGSAAEKPSQGEVLAIGAGKVLDNGSIHPMHVKVGDKVLFKKYSSSSHEIKFEGEDVIIMNEDDVLAILG